MDLQPFQRAPFNGKPQHERSRQSHDRDPARKFDYPKHNSSNSNIPSNRIP